MTKGSKVSTLHEFVQRKIFFGVLVCAVEGSGNFIRKARAELLLGRVEALRNNLYPATLIGLTGTSKSKIKLHVMLFSCQ